MKLNYFNFSVLVQSWADAYIIDVFRSACDDKSGWFYIYTNMKEISFESLTDLNNDLKDWNLSIWSVYNDNRTQGLTIIIR